MNVKANRGEDKGNSAGIKISSNRLFAVSICYGQMLRQRKAITISIMEVCLE